jgi:hypothetical protein
MFDFLLWQHVSDRALIEWRAGSLDNTRSAIMEDHLMVCPTCQLQLEDLLPRTEAPGLLELCGAKHAGASRCHTVPATAA